MDANRPILTVGGPIDSCSVTLCIYGTSLDPEHISRLLEATPTSFCRQGDVRSSITGPAVEKQGRWLLKVNLPDDATLDCKVQFLLSQLTDNTQIWEVLTREYQIRINCGIQILDWNRGFDLQPKTLKLLAERNLSLDFDIYYIGESESRHA